jgi:hypothetical protein
MAIRNLTHERQLAYLKTRKAQELTLVGAHETVIETVAKPGPKKNDPVEYVERRVSKRDFLTREHDERIAKFAKDHGLAA